MIDLQLNFISNPTTFRWFNILNFIERNRVFTISELAEEFNMSQRTIANDLRELKEHFVDCAIFNSSSSGFTFEEVSLSLYKERKKKLLENEILFELIENIFYGKLERIDELAYSYNYSESTFRRLLSKCSPQLKSYGLAWKSNPLTINGNEASLRKFYKDFFYEGIETPYSIFPDQKLQDLLLNTLSDGLNIANYNVASGTTPTAFYYDFTIAIKRAQHGFKVSIPNQLLEQVYEEKDFLLLLSLEEGIHDIFGFHLPKEEFAWIYLVTVCNRTFNYEKFESNFYTHFNLWPELEGITEKYLRELTTNARTRSKLAIFLKSFFLSIKIKDCIDPVLNKEAVDILNTIMSRDNSLFERNLKFLQQFYSHLLTSDKYIQDICTSLTSYSILLFEYYAPSKKVFFLLEGNHLAYQFIRIKAIQKFGNKHTLVFIPIQTLTREKLSMADMDLLVTNYSRYISDVIGDINYILIKTIPDNRDWLNIQTQLNSC